MAHTHHSNFGILIGRLFRNVSHTRPDTFNKQRRLWRPTISRTFLFGILFGRIQRPLRFWRVTDILTPRFCQIMTTTFRRPVTVRSRTRQGLTVSTYCIPCAAHTGIHPMLAQLYVKDFDAKKGGGSNKMRESVVLKELSRPCARF